MDATQLELLQTLQKQLAESEARLKHLSAVHDDEQRALDKEREAVQQEKVALRHLGVVQGTRYAPCSPTGCERPESLVAI